MLTHLINSIVNFIASTGYTGVAVLMAIESAAIPIPSEVIMPFAGYLVFLGKLSLLGAALAGAIGSVIGSLFIYYLARLGGRPLVERYGRYIFISGRDLDKAENFFSKHGVWSTFVGRCLPVVRTYISVPAGVAKMKVVPFAVAAFVGSFLWSLLLAYIGQSLGSRWDSFHEHFKSLDYVILGLIVVLIVGFLIKHRIDPERKRAQERNKLLK